MFVYYSSTIRYLGCCFTDVNSAVINIHVHIFVGKPIKTLSDKCLKENVQSTVKD